MIADIRRTPQRVQRARPARKPMLEEVTPGTWRGSAGSLCCLVSVTDGARGRRGPSGTLQGAYPRPAVIVPCCAAFWGTGAAESAGSVRILQWRWPRCRSRPWPQLRPQTRPHFRPRGPVHNAWSPAVALTLPRRMARTRSKVVRAGFLRPFRKYTHPNPSMTSTSLG